MAPSLTPPAVSPQVLEQILALDQLTLRQHTEQAGDVLDPAIQRVKLAQLLAEARLCCVWRGELLVAYAMLRPESPDCWFVTGFSTHPAQRNASVLRELFSQTLRLSSELGIKALRSHVYKTNRLSLAFHTRLGFHITRENAKAVEFFAEVKDLQLGHMAATIPAAVV